MDDGVKKRVPTFVSLLTYFGMLVVALVFLVGPKALANSNIVFLCFQLGWLFPCGLGFLVGGPGSRFVGLTFVVISYMSFIVFLVAFVRARTWATYGFLCIGFAILLLLNVAGCREAHEGMSGITTMPNSIPDFGNVEFDSKKDLRGGLKSCEQV